MADRSEEARARAEANFKKKEQKTQEAAEVWAERATAAKASDKNAARLKALRLAKEAADRTKESKPVRKAPAKRGT